MFLEGAIVAVDRAWKIHHVPGVSIGHDWQHQHLIGNLLARAACNSERTDEVDVQRQVRPMLLDRTAGNETNLPDVDGIINLGPSQFFIAILGRGTARHGDLLPGETEEAMILGSPTGQRNQVQPVLKREPKTGRAGKPSNRG